MNKSALIFLAMAAALCGCKPSDDRVPRADEKNVPRVQSSASSNADTSDRVAAQEKLSSSLKDMDAKLADLKAKAITAGDQAKAEWEARRPQLEAQRDAAAKKLDELKASSKETWDETRTKTEAAFAEIEKGFKEAWAKIKE